MPINQNVVGIISYNFYGGYVNYGAVLQSYALQKVLDKLGVPNLIVDYIPEHFRSVNMGLPIAYMIREGNGAFLRWLCNCVPIYRVDKKFKSFIKKHCRVTETTYTKENFDQLDLDTFIIGSDTVWSIRESLCVRLVVV